MIWNGCKFKFYKGNIMGYNRKLFYIINYKLEEAIGYIVIIIIIIIICFEWEVVSVKGK